MEVCHVLRQRAPRAVAHLWPFLSSPLHPRNGCPEPYVSRMRGGGPLLLLCLAVAVGPGHSFLASPAIARAARPSCRVRANARFLMSVRRVLVTGGNKGIGKAICGKLLSDYPEVCASMNRLRMRMVLHAMHACWAPCLQLHPDRLLEMCGHDSVMFCWDHALASAARQL